MLDRLKAAPLVIRWRGRGGTLVLAGAHGTVRRVIEIVGGEGPGDVILRCPGVHERLAYRRRRAVRRQDPVTGLMGAGTVALLPLLLSSLLADLPQTALGAVVIAAALSLVDVAAVRRYWRVSPAAAVVSLTAVAGVVFAGVLTGESSSPSRWQS